MPRGLKRIGMVKSEVTESAGYYVLIPPADDLKTAERTLARVKESQLLDSRLFRSGPLINAVSLGFFSQRDNAERWAESVRKKGFEVVLKEKSIAKDTFRLRVKGANTSVHGLALKQISDGKMQRIACP